MPTFDTPGPIMTTARVEAGSLRFTATDRTDTVVVVRPRTAGKDVDARAAEQTEVTFTNGVLTIRTPKPHLLGLGIGRVGSVDVTVELPTGSDVETTGSWTHVFAEGRLGEVRVKTSSGDVRLDETGPLDLTSAHGSITVDRVAGRAELTTSSGSVRIGSVDGPATVKNSHGTTTVGTVTGELRVRNAVGDIDVTRAEGSVTAVTAHGTLRIAEVTRGTVQVETSHGAIEIGVRASTATWLDADAGAGRVHNALAASAPPAGAEETVKIRARTKYGNIAVRRTKA